MDFFMWLHPFLEMIHKNHWIWGRFFGMMSEKMVQYPIPCSGYPLVI